MSKLAIVGPQFADPMLFGGWLARRYGFTLATVTFGEHDHALVAENVMIGDREWRVHVLLRACWDVELAHQTALVDADHVLVSLCRCAATQHLNGEGVEAAIRHLSSSAKVVTAINDPYCERPGFPAADPDVVRRPLPAGWSVHFTRCGNCDGTKRCDQGVEAVFEELLGLR